MSSVACARGLARLSAAGFWSRGVTRAEDIAANLNRVREALTKKPDTIAVACPYCMTMIEDGLKDEKADNVHVVDIAEIVAGKLEK